MAETLPPGARAGFIRRHRIASFYALAVAFPTVLFIYFGIMVVIAQGSGGPDPMVAFRHAQEATRAAHPIITAHRDGVPTSVLSYIAFPRAAPFLFFPFAPTVSALIILRLGWGRAAVARLLGAYRPVRGDISWRRAGLIYACLTAMLVAAGTLSIVAVYFAAPGDIFGAVMRTFHFDDWRLFLSALLVGLFANQGGLLEELGWRGYLWPILARRMPGQLLPVLILGTMWALWHFPREVPLLLMGQQGLGELSVGQALFITSCCAMSIVAVLFVNLTGGSVVPAIMVHGTFNLMFEAMTLHVAGARGDPINPSLAMWLALAAIVLALFGPDLGWRARLAAHGGDGRNDPSRLWSRSDEGTHVS